MATMSVQRGRLAIARSILDSAGWESETWGLDVLIEIAAIGHIRLHRRAALASKVEELSAENQERYDSEQEKVTAGQVLADRFHDSMISFADGNRLSIPTTVTVALLGPNANVDSVRLFVQSGDDTVDIMTNEVRLARLHKYKL